MPIRSAEITQSTHQQLCKLSANAMKHCLLPLPTPCAKGVDIDWHCGYGCFLGGAFLDFPQCPAEDIENKNRVIAALGMVSDHQSCSALVISTVRAYLRATVAQTDDLGSVVTDVNQLMYYDPRIPTQQLTLLMLAVDCAKRSVTWVNAGYSPVFIFRDNPGRLECMEGDRTVIGEDSRTQYYANTKSNLQPGDVIAVASEGLLEPLNSGQEMLGSDRLLSIFKENRNRAAHSIRQSVFNALKSSHLSEAPKDEAILLVIKITDDKKGIRSMSSCSKTQGIITEDFSCSIRSF